MQPAELTNIFYTLLEADQVPETGGLIQAGTSVKVNKLGLALDWDSETIAWAEAEKLDAVWLHRLPPNGGKFPDHLAVIIHHAAFDRRFGLSANSTLHQDLGVASFHMLSDRPALSIVRLNLPILQQDLADTLRARFGGIERTYGYGTRLTILAFADSMHSELLHAAASAGAEIYITGQWRPNAEAAAEELGLSVITIGHAPIERRGLHDMAALVQPGLTGVKLLVHD
jgi:putative NIF3 family GTP cyclohydrolase 1 type 2